MEHGLSWAWKGTYHTSTAGMNTACAGEEEDGPETDDEDPNMPDLPRDPVTGRRLWQGAPTTTSVVQDDAIPRGRHSVVGDDATPRADSVVQDDDATPRGDEPSEIEAEDEVEEIESLPTGILPPDVDDDDRAPLRLQCCDNAHS
jgi:hypothetical protein